MALGAGVGMCGGGRQSGLLECVVWWWVGVSRRLLFLRFVFCVRFVSFARYRVPFYVFPCLSHLWVSLFLFSPLV